MALEEKLRQFRIPIAACLLAASWIALWAPEPVRMAVFAASFALLLLSFTNQSTGWKSRRGLDFKAPVNAFFSLGFWITLLGLVGYRYVLGHDVDIVPSLIPIVAMNHLPWSDDLQPTG